MADNPKTFDTGLTKAQIAEAFNRALNDMTDAQIRALVASEETARENADITIEAKISALEARVAALEEKE